MNKKIIWVDDDINNPELQPERDELELSNIDVEAYDNTDDFLKRIEEIDDKPNCVVMDMNMPIDGIIVDMSIAVGKKFDIVEAKKGMRTGMLLIEKLLEKKQFQGVPIIVYSVVDQDEDLKHFCRENTIKYWNKSDCMPDEFAEKIKRIIEKNESEGHENISK